MEALLLSFEGYRYGIDGVVSFIIIMIIEGKIVHDYKQRFEIDVVQAAPED